MTGDPGLGVDNKYVIRLVATIMIITVRSDERRPIKRLQGNISGESPASFFVLMRKIVLVTVRDFYIIDPAQHQLRLPGLHPRCCLVSGLGDGHVETLAAHSGPGHS